MDALAACCCYGNSSLLLKVIIAHKSKFRCYFCFESIGCESSKASTKHLVLYFDLSPH